MAFSQKHTIESLATENAALVDVNAVLTKEKNELKRVVAMLIGQKSDVRDGSKAAKEEHQKKNKW